jgi:hypothetical protein
MGKGKGTFDHWASRIAVSKIIFEVKGDIHEQVARDAFRLAGNKMPGNLPPASFCCESITNYVDTGLYEFVKKGDPPVVGITKLDGITLEELKRPRREIPLETIPTVVTTESLSSTSSSSSSMSPAA